MANSLEHLSKTTNYPEVLKLLNFYEKHNYLYGNLLIYQAGEVIYQNSYGFANLEMRVPNQRTTKFKIASLTKAFTSMLVFILQERKLLCVDDAVNKHCPEAACSDHITIYHCLTNSSGIPDFASEEDYWDTTMRLSHSLEDLIESMRVKPLLFTPGSDYAYSSTGFLIVTRIIEKVTGKTYSECLNELILQPLGMQNSGCIDEITIIDQLADSYSFWIREIQAAKTAMSFPTGAAGMYSTVDDLLKWSQAILLRKLIAKPAYLRMLTNFQATYACGWDIAEIAGHTCFQHRGDLDGFVSSIKIIDQMDTVVIFLSNLEIIPVTAITQQIMDCLLGKKWQEPQEIPTVLDVNLQEMVVGKYAFADSSNRQMEELLISFEENQLFLTVNKRYAIPYKFKLILLRDQQGKLVLRTDKINETITFFSAPRQEIHYRNYENQEYKLQKL